MEDRIAPVLLGITLPATIDLAQATPALVRANVSDAGGAGSVSVTVFLDTDFSQVLPSKPSYARERVDSFSLYGGMTGDGASLTLSGSVPMSRGTAPGSYQVLKVVLTDAAGNRTVYSPGELQAMGAATTIEVKGGIADTTAPVLLDLSLPATYDIMGGDVLRPLVTVQDNAGGSGVDRVIVRFEGDSGIYTYTSIRPQATPDVLPQDGQPVSLNTPGIYLNPQTPSGVNRIADVTVIDIAGNQTVYTRAQLEAQGMNTTLSVLNGASKTAAFTQALEDGALELDIGSSAWTGAGNSFRLALSYDSAAAQFDSAALGTYPGLTVSVVTDGSLGRVTVTASGISAAEALAGIHLTLRPVEGKLGHWWVQEFTVNGQSQGFGPGIAGGAFLQGVDGVDLADVRGYSNGEGVVGKTADGWQVVTANGYTTLLSDVEGVILGAAGRVAFDGDGAAAQLYRLYQAAVDRAPDAAGLGYWIHQVESGASLQDVARAFMAGAEFGDLYGSGLSDDAFIAALYDNVLERAPDAAGLAWWREAFADGLTREEALVYFSQSEENLAQVAPAIADGIEYTLW